MSPRALTVAAAVWALAATIAVAILAVQVRDVRRIASRADRVSARALDATKPSEPVLSPGQQYNACRAKASADVCAHLLN